MPHLPHPLTPVFSPVVVTRWTLHGWSTSYWHTKAGSTTRRTSSPGKTSALGHGEGFRRSSHAVGHLGSHCGQRRIWERPARDGAESSGCRSEGGREGLGRGRPWAAGGPGRGRDWAGEGLGGGRAWAGGGTGGGRDWAGGGFAAYERLWSSRKHGPQFVQGWVYRGNMAGFTGLGWETWTRAGGDIPLAIGRGGSSVSSAVQGKRGGGVSNR